MAARGRAGHKRGDAALTSEIVAVHDESKGTYGSPRVHAELRPRGRRHSRKRIARLLRAAGLAGRASNRWRTTTPDPAAAVPADLIKRDFSCVATDINTRWCVATSPTSTPGPTWPYLARSSSTPKAGTRPADCTPPSATSAPPATKRSCVKQPNHLNHPVRQTGSTPRAGMSREATADAAWTAGDDVTRCGMPGCRSIPTPVLKATTRRRPASTISHQSHGWQAALT
ncbi:IS3 family transposase [Amycolatopsis sp. DSM 110486]|nr:IS3 family transposase [Amycolatopsis sp. DSM 110486]